MAFCSKCGTETSEGSTFCGKCGNATSAVATAAIPLTTEAVPRSDVSSPMNTTNVIVMPMKGADETHCESCGAVIKKAAELCPKCGVRRMTADVKSHRSWTVLLVLSIFLGTFGIDRFYAGRIGTGILKFITLGCFGVWWLIDLIIIATGKMRDNMGRFIKN